MGLFGDIFKPVGQVLRAVGSFASGLTQTVGMQFITNPIAFSPTLPGGTFNLSLPSAVQPPLVGTPMALNLGGILGTVGQAFGGQGGFLGNVGTALNIASQFVPAPKQAPQIFLASSAAPSSPLPSIPSPMNLPMVGRGGTTQEVFTAGIKVLNKLGLRPTTSSFNGMLRRTIGSIASLARRTPAGTVVSILAGLGLTALEANLLTAWHVQRRRGRRMNPTNVHALRRAGRRIKSFHKLCQTLDTARRPVSRGRKCAKVC